MSLVNTRLAHTSRPITLHAICKPHLSSCLSLCLSHTLSCTPSTRQPEKPTPAVPGTLALERAYNTRHPGHTDSHSNGSISGPTLNWSRNLTTRLRRIVTPSAYHTADRTKPNLSNSVAKLGCFSLAPTPSTPSPPKSSNSSPGGIDDRGRLDTVRTPVVRNSLDTSGPVLAHFHRSISDREVRRNSILGGGSLEQKKGPRSAFADGERIRSICIPPPLYKKVGSKVKGTVFVAYKLEKASRELFCSCDVVAILRRRGIRYQARYERSS